MGGEPVDGVCPEWWSHGAEFPDWHVWRGVSGLYYASLDRSSPKITVRGEDPVDLHDEVVRADGKRRWRR